MKDKNGKPPKEVEQLSNENCWINMTTSMIQQAQKTIDDFNNYIVWVIEKMVDTEYNFLMKKENYSIIIEEGVTESWFHTLEKPPYTDKSQYKVVLRYDPKTYKLVKFNGEAVVIEFAECNLVIPLQLTDDTFNGFFEFFQKDLEEHVAKLEAKQKERRKEADIEKKKRDKLHGLHHDGKYSYQWEKCERCDGDCTIVVGTGRWEHQGDYDREGDYVKSEVMENITCPDCKGHGGFIHYTDDGTDNLYYTKPCNLYTFEHHQDDFTKIMLNR